jgi:NAD(P)-dependent dehydrogenase (short-subunit alcohol dehydrogenase family)
MRISDMRLQDKAAIVTGGANGIGRATAVTFAREGARVVIADRDVSQGKSCVRRIVSSGASAIYVETDVSLDRDISRLVDLSVDEFGGIDILVNSAGVDLRGTVVETEPEKWKRILDVNLASIYRTCRFVIPHMIERHGGSIVNVASIQGMYGWPRYAAYAASKAGIIGLTRQIAVDYAGHNIRSNAVSPGGIATRLAENTSRLEPDFPEDRRASRTSNEPGAKTGDRPLLDLGKPEDVAYAVLFLASDEASHISGHNLVVDGIATARVE